MALLKIARMGHPVLQSKALAVGDPTSPEIAQLVHDMIDTMEDAHGTGLAAPQVYKPLRLVIYKVSGARDASEGGLGAEVPLTVLINPEITPLSDDKAFGWEGCLSLPGMMGRVPRHTHILVKSLDLEGNIVEREAKGFHARVIQHECDHLDGILYPYRVEDMDTFGFTEELMRRGHEAGDLTEDEAESDPE